MTLIQRITREPVLIIGVLTAAFGVATVFGVDLTKDQIGAIVVLAGAVMALLRFITTPASEVVVQRKPGGEIVTGQAADGGGRIDEVRALFTHRDNVGALELGYAIILAALGAVILLWLLGAFGPSPLR